MDRVNPVLARKLGLAPERADGAEPEAPPEQDAPLRLMRRALARAADKSVGLSASVLGIAEEEMDAETVIEEGPDGWVILGLRDAGQAGLCGMVLLDPALRSALVEMQTMGHLLPPADEPRKVTRTDAVMTEPFAALLLQELQEAGFGEEVTGPGGLDLCPMPDLRTVGLVMAQGSYQNWRITVQFGGTEAQGEIVLALRRRPSVQTKARAPSGAWAQALREAVAEAPAELEAVLCEMTLSLRRIEGFEVGQVLPLAGTTVGSVVLHGPGGEEIAAARLGQVAGKRAVRVERPHVELETAEPPHMAMRAEIEAPEEAAPASGGGAGGSEAAAEFEPQGTGAALADSA